VDVVKDVISAALLVAVVAEPAAAVALVDAAVALVAASPALVVAVLA
jgi:hypothetical protein